ncbi:MAG: MCP four helix bundle domain-containing protein, partial [Roseburia sp.]
MEKQKQPRKASIKLMILIPVLILGVSAVISNVLGMSNIKRVNQNATMITDESMVKIENLFAIEEKTQNIHTMALSHIIATDFDTMIGLVWEIEAQEAELEEYLSGYEQYVSQEEAESYKGLVTSYQSFKLSVINLLAYSANQNSVAAYACANGDVSTYANQMQGYIETMNEYITEDTNAKRTQLASIYQTASVVNMMSIALCILVSVTAIIVVMRFVIGPVLSASKEISQIIADIDNREGDLTKRITIKMDDEIAALSRGINTFMEKLQSIFGVITNNSDKMETVVAEVLSSVQTSNESASDLSALT